jgi:hypothetical protein
MSLRTPVKQPNRGRWLRSARTSGTWDGFGCHSDSDISTIRTHAGIFGRDPQGLRIYFSMRFTLPLEGDQK